jgi:tRNA-splicing ligase RtcB
MSRIYFDEPGALLTPDDADKCIHAPIRVWATSLDEATIHQLREIASQPYVVLHVAAMADAHVAQGVAVGTVFATEKTVVPSALGGDLGCGMSAVRLGVPADTLDRRTLQRLLENLGKAIPTGDGLHRGRGVVVSDELLASSLSTRALEHTREALAPRHLGTLGGGNHFVELERDMDGDAWLLVHSGSRGLGAAIAGHHARAATGADPRRALQGLDTTEEKGAAYLGDLEWALAFARANRRALCTKALEVISDVLGSSLEREDVLDIHHNFIARETWFGRDLLVHRKGAVAVPRGTRALIPGSMGTASYVVDGLGNENAFGSCSHGAGRVMSRKEARQAIKPQALDQAMRRVVYPRHLARSLVEESPAAYRDITEVLDAQRDLVTRVQRLEPIAVLKG